ncbi:MAG: glutathione S-transferase family protein [Hyphomicrobium sp.]|nr:glutathione S-transferase family protein [Hyphomicrobium sp.]
MYKLIGSPKTRAFRVMWMLHELGEAFELDPTPPRDPKLAAINPSLKVPVLQDGSDYVIDSVAICQYLADKHGRLTFKAGTIDRAHQDSFTQFAVDDVESCIWVAAKHTFALPEEYRVPDVKRACQFDFDRAMKSLSARLGDKQFVMGDTFTVPDLLLGHTIGWAASMKWTPPDGNVADYVARVRARPAFAAATAQRDALK